MNQQIAVSKGLNTTKTEKCQVCLKSFKSVRGVKIHQGKSGCKIALGHNRFDKSKPEVGDIREPHHSDFSYTNKPEKGLVKRQSVICVTREVPLTIF